MCAVLHGNRDSGGEKFQIYMAVKSCDWFEGNCEALHVLMLKKFTFMSVWKINSCLDDKYMN